MEEVYQDYPYFKEKTVSWLVMLVIEDEEIDSVVNL